jgi:hypothetical protein
MDDKIRVLFLAANPINAGRLRLNEEAREIQQKLASGTHREIFELISKFATRPNDLQLALLEHRPHIVHFSGHGKGPQGILLQDNSGKSKLVSLSALSTLFRLRKDNIRVVIFNACYSKPQAGAFSEMIDYTIGTTNNIGDQAAIAFAASFYRALAFGLSVADGFELAKNELALNAIRNTGSPKMFIRTGVDPSTSFVTEVVGPINKEISAPPSLDRVAAGVERLSEGLATPNDARTIQHGVVTGSIVLERTDHVASGPLKRDKEQTNRQQRKIIHPGTIFDEHVVATRGSRKAPGSKQRTRRPRKDEPRVGTLVDVRIGTIRDERQSMRARESRADNSLDLEIGLTAYERVQENLFPSPPGLPPPLPSLIFVGREQALSDVKKLLALSEDQPPSEQKVVVIRGWPGVGKTAFVSILARDPQVLKAFPDGVLWTSLGSSPELLTKMVEWGRALGTDEILRTPTVDEAVAKLAVLLRHRRMLLIVDDIWKPEHALPFLKAGGSGCAFVATTRLPSVAEAISSDPAKIYVLPVLTESHAMDLFRYFSPSSVEKQPDACRALAHELGYLPLALQVAGRLLRSEKGAGLSVVELLEGIREDAQHVEESAPLDRTAGWVTPTVHALLKRSTDELDERTRTCFAFLAAFAPKPATFDAAAMKAVWDVNNPAPTIRKLVGHGLLEPTGSGRFQMHPLIVLHARSLLES